MDIHKDFFLKFKTFTEGKRIVKYMQFMSQIYIYICVEQIKQVIANFVSRMMFFSPVLKTRYVLFIQTNKQMVKRQR